jgi:hypothetical protein
MLQGIYTDTRLDMAESGQLAKYRADALKLDETEIEERWKNGVIRSWNGIVRSGAEKEQDELDIEIEMLSGQLEKLDEIFMEHFEKVGKFFLTTSTAWTKVMPLYAKSLQAYADDLSQAPGGTPMVKKIREALPDKMRWVMMDHGNLQVAPVMPLMTRSVVALVVDSLRAMALALYEVSCYDNDGKDEQVEYVRAARVSGEPQEPYGIFGSLEKSGQVEYIRPARHLAMSSHKEVRG